MKTKEAAIICLLVIFVSTSLSFAVATTSAASLSQNEISTSVFWSMPMYPGAYGQANVTVVNNSSQSIIINEVGIHFDWNVANTYFYNHLKTPIDLPVNGNYTIVPIAFYVLVNQTVGTHSYYVNIEGETKSNQAFNWNSQTSTVQVYTAETTYNQLLPLISNKTAAAQAANYLSPDAKSLLKEAIDDYNQATASAKISQWQAGATDLQSASSLLNTAAEEEQMYSPPAPNYPFLGIVIIVSTSLIILAAIIVLRLKGKNQTKDYTKV